MTTVKSRRIEQRIDPETEELVSKAAAMLDESVSSFVVRSARTEAERVLARSDLTLMPAEQFDAMVEALDAVPWRLSRLAKEAERPRRFTRR